MRPLGSSLSVFGSPGWILGWVLGSGRDEDNTALSWWGFYPPSHLGNLFSLWRGWIGVLGNEVLHTFWPRGVHTPVDPWAQIWAAQVHLYVDFCQQIHVIVPRDWWLVDSMDAAPQTGRASYSTWASINTPKAHTLPEVTTLNHLVFVFTCTCIWTRIVTSVR